MAYRKYAKTIRRRASKKGKKYAKPVLQGKSERPGKTTLKRRTAVYKSLKYGPVSTLKSAVNYAYSSSLPAYIRPLSEARQVKEIIKLRNLAKRLNALSECSSRHVSSLPKAQVLMPLIGEKAVKLKDPFGGDYGVVNYATFNKQQANATTSG